MMMTMLLMISMALPMKMMTMTTTILALENLKEQENRYIPLISTFPLSPFFYSFTFFSDEEDDDAVDDDKPNCITSLYT